MFEHFSLFQIQSIEAHNLNFSKINILNRFIYKFKEYICIKLQKRHTFNFRVKNQQT